MYPIIQKLKVLSPLVDYADDIALIVDGDEQKVLATIDQAEEILKQYGLLLNRSKCKICYPNEPNSFIEFLG